MQAVDELGRRPHLLENLLFESGALGLERLGLAEDCFRAILVAAFEQGHAEMAHAELNRGAPVRHQQFGDGTILTMEGNGPDAKLTVYFERAGSKKFIAKYAKLTRI